MLCVRLLIKLRGVVAVTAPGTEVRVVTTDPAAPIDLPSWCHLTGHEYLGRIEGGTDAAPERAVHALRVSAGARNTRPDRPWHLVRESGEPE
ncbi:sulfurtransferase TusA family protein [Kineosporia sp. J2-2]|uniref:Sulfurtransferase TusA family protein n=2 Tax=Kineosporia corallincola TaxID=2835133 RepID=A0ABS5TCK2_9ACTN|nr:sulfurtransferase TusA family protein [Kineosporia corallincola]MBT0768811.1 sulfurtransferase TusA family protein [Kineosporia corallincola]